MPGTLTVAFDAAVTAHADRVAVIDVDGSSITYRELDRLADAMARALVDSGVGPGDRVGVCRRKSVGTVAGLIGIMRVGAAYVPVDPSSPVDRNRTIFSDCGVAAVLLDDRSALGDEWKGAVVVGDPPPGDAPSQVTPPSVDDLAYVLYTSGSTGRPKGVCLEHRHATSFVDWCVRTFDAGPDDRCSSHAPFHFDLSILDLWMPLASGGAVVLVEEGLAKDPRRLAAFIADRRITNWYSVPSILSLMAEHGELVEHDHASLRTVCFAGEVFPLAGLKALRSAWPEPVFWNLYGPTETNVCTAQRIPATIEPDRVEPFPIGRPCDHCEVAVVDEQGIGVAAGETGRIVCRGGPVMRGYWGRAPEETEAFVDLGGQRWYDTGDLGSFLEDGAIHFSGRRDRMVKRHGYRIELGEIEAGLDRADFLSEAAVVSVEHEGAVSIHAFVVSATDSPASVIALRTHCASVLPPYMTPDRFHAVDELPRTATGKVDLARLRSTMESLR